MEYRVLVDLYSQLESTSKRLEKTRLLSSFLKSCNDVDKVVLLVQGRVFPSWDSRELGMAARLLLKALSLATGATVDKIEILWGKTGDLGLAAECVVKNKSQVTLFSQGLTVQKVFDNLRKLAELEGAGTVDRKVQGVAELLTSASPIEAKYIVRTILGELRVGLGEGTLRDAIVWAFFGDVAKITFDDELKIGNREKYNFYVSLVQEALDVVNDFAEVALLAKEGESRLVDVRVVPGKPLKVMKYQKATSIENAFEIVGKPAAFEYKYDGFMVQIHKIKKKVKLFTRSLEDVTDQFPDVVRVVLDHVKCSVGVFDAEIVGVDVASKKYLPFQKISQRIKRKYDITDMAKSFPVEVNVFDATVLEGNSLLKVPFQERRSKVVEIVEDIPLKIKPAIQVVTDNVEAAEKFYNSALSGGNEGVMAKNLQGFYKPGSRVGYGVKVKPTMDTLEVVIVGAERGEGKRGEWLASFVVAVQDSESGELLEVGKVGTGLKEKDEEGTSFAELTALLTPLIVEEIGRMVRVRPKIVIEVDYEEIQKSPSYSSGFALRFPRFVKLRIDRSEKDINTIDDVRLLAEGQRGRGGL